jgi:hypothetical protein
LAHSKNALRLAAQILKNINMKKSPNTKTESFDEIIARFQRNFDEAPNGPLKEFCQEYMNDLIVQKNDSIKATEVLIKKVIKSTIKEIRLCYPDLLAWKKEPRFFQLQITKGLFVNDMINEFGKEIQSVSVTCNDGIVRIFDIKLEAFGGCGRHGNSKPKRCVNVSYSLSEPSNKDNQIPVEDRVN